MIYKLGTVECAKTVKLVSKTRNDRKEFTVPAVDKKTLEKREDFSIVGYVDLANSNRSKKQVQIENCLVNIKPKLKAFERAQTYLYVGNDEFIGIPKKRLGLILCILGVLVISLVITLKLSLKQPNNTYSSRKTIANGTDFNGVTNGDKVKDKQGNIKFYGYTEQYASSDKKDIILGNPAENDVYFEYVISDESGTVLYKSALISPGKAVNWKAKDTLAVGTYNLALQINTYDMVDTSKAYNGMKCGNVVFHIYE